MYNKITLIGKKNIAYSKITNGTLSKQFWNLIEGCNTGIVNY